MSFTPLVQMLMTLQFQPALNRVSVFDLAGVMAGFRQQFPTASEVPAAGPMVYSFSQLDGSEEVPFDATTTPRLKLTNPDTHETLLFQHDRMSFGWVRGGGIDSDHDYQGFDHSYERLMEIFFELQERIAQYLEISVSCVAGEIAYTNALPLDDEDGTRRKLSTIFTFLNGTRSFEMRGWEFAWNEVLSHDGILAVKAEGPAVIPGNKEAGILSLTATFPVATLDEDELKRQFTDHHDQVYSTFQRIVYPDRLARY